MNTQKNSYNGYQVNNMPQKEFTGLTLIHRRKFEVNSVYFNVKWDKSPDARNYFT